MAEPFDSIGKLLTEYPNMGPGTLVVMGAGIGFVIGWGVWQARNSHLVQVNESLKDALADKVPPGSIAHLLRPRRPRLGPTIVAICLIGAAIGALVWYFQSTGSSAADKTNAAADLQPKLNDLTKERDGLSANLANAERQTTQLQASLGDMTRQRDEALRRINPLPAQPPQSNLTADQIATKIDVWASIDQQMNSLARILNEGYSMLDTWVSNSRSDHAAATKRAQALAESVSQYRAQLDNLRRTYIEFPDIAETLKEAINPPGRPTEDSTIFDRLLRSTGGFAQELGSLGDPLPENLENVMRARAGAVRRDLNAVREWQSKTRTAAANSINQLQK